MWKCQIKLTFPNIGGARNYTCPHSYISMISNHTKNAVYCAADVTVLTHRLLTPVIGVLLLLWSRTHTMIQTHKAYLLRINCFADIAIHNTKIYVWIWNFVYKFFFLSFFFSHCLFLLLLTFYFVWFFGSVSTQFWIIHIIRAWISETVMRKSVLVQTRNIEKFKYIFF